MKPMTEEEFSKADLDVDAYYEYHYTRMPATIGKIHRQLFHAVADVMMWLHDVGVETPHDFYVKDGLKKVRERLMEQTTFEISICHDNDYIEMGPHTPDPRGQMFHVITPFNMEVKFKPEDTLYVTQQLALFSERKLEINRRLPHISLSFYSWERKIKMDSMNSSPQYGIKLKYNLKFEAHHTWGSELNNKEE